MSNKVKRGRKTPFQKELIALLNAGATQAKLAKLLNVSEASISMWLRGKSKPRFSTWKGVNQKMPFIVQGTTVINQDMQKRFEVQSDPLLSAIEQIEHLKTLLQELVSLKS